MTLEQGAQQAQQDLKAAMEARAVVNRALVAEVKKQETSGTAVGMVQGRATQRASLDKQIAAMDGRITKEIDDKRGEFEARQRAAAELFEKKQAPYRAKAEGRWWGKEKAIEKVNAERDGFQRKQQEQAKEFEAYAVRRQEQLAAWKDAREATFKASEPPDMQKARDGFDYAKGLREDLKRQRDQATAYQAGHDRFSGKEAQLAAAGDARGLKVERLKDLAWTKKEEAGAWRDTAQAMEDLGQKDTAEYAEASRKAEEVEAEAKELSGRFSRERESIPRPVLVDIEQGIDWRHDPFDMEEANRREAELLDDMPEEDRAAAQASDEKHATKKAAQFNQGVELAYRTRLNGSDHSADLVGARTDRYGAEAAAARWTRIAERERSIHGDTGLYRDALARRDVANEARDECNFRREHLKKQHAEGKHRDGYELVPSWAMRVSTHRADGHTEKEPPFSEARTERAEGERKARMMPDYAMQGGSAALGRQQQAKSPQQSAEAQARVARLEQERTRQGGQKAGNAPIVQRPSAYARENAKDSAKDNTSRGTNGGRSKADLEAEKQAIAAREAAARTPPNNNPNNPTRK